MTSTEQELWRYAEIQSGGWYATLAVVIGRCSQIAIALECHVAACADSTAASCCSRMEGYLDLNVTTFQHQELPNWFIYKLNGYDTTVQ